ncbi:MAG: hypothetical protein WBN66_04650 [Smithella sp.]
MESIFTEMAAKWPSAIVARTEAEKFTGGLIGERYLANLDSQGKGCPKRIRIGRKIAYPINEFIKWLENRSEAVTGRGE